MTVDGVDVKTITGFPDYAISRDGRVWSVPRRGPGSFNSGIWRKPHESRGYLRLKLMKDKKQAMVFVHDLVLAAYVGPRPAGMECRHLDGDRRNNNLENLKWGTRKENHADALRHGTHSSLHQKKKLTPDDVKLIYYDYHIRGRKQRDIAVEFGVSQRTVWHIVHKIQWKKIWV